MFQFASVDAFSNKESRLLSILEAELLSDVILVVSDLEGPYLRQLDIPTLPTIRLISSILVDTRNLRSIWR